MQLTKKDFCGNYTSFPFLLLLKQKKLHLKLRWMRFWHEKHLKNTISFLRKKLLIWNLLKFNQSQSSFQKWLFLHIRSSFLLNFDDVQLCGHPYYYHHNIRLKNNAAEKKEYFREWENDTKAFNTRDRLFMARIFFAFFTTRLTCAKLMFSIFSYVCFFLFFP